MLVLQNLDQRHWIHGNVQQRLATEQTIPASKARLSEENSVKETVLTIHSSSTTLLLLDT